VLGLEKGVFSGVRIVELAQFVFVPGAGALLADLGAEVIKLEGLGGDPYRTVVIHDGRQTKSANLAMEQNNRGKKSVAINLKNPAGRELTLKLIESADVFLTSIRPKAIERLGLGLDALRARNPKLIYVHGNGYGFHGPDADRAGFDGSCFWARGGFAHALRAGVEGPPVRQRAALGDHTGALSIAMGIASALYRRERTGKPSHVQVSLLATAMWVLSADICASQTPGYTEALLYSREFEQPLARAYKTSDNRWVHLMLLDSQRYWPELCRRLDQPNLANDERFVSVDLRAKNGRALCALLDDIFSRITSGEVRVALGGWDAAWEFIATVCDVAADPQGFANGCFFDVKVSDGTSVRLVSGPVAIDGTPMQIEPTRAPLKGEHSDEVLQKLGISADRLDQLKAEGVVG
jgi:crotonobetainyl-CoA:carnitine CoA-transferase CaiB-like acyl-CoA transferase